MTEPGPLTGIPVLLKDNMSTAGVETTAASKILSGYVPPYDAEVVSRLNDAGAVMIGSATFLMIGAFDALWDLVHTDLQTPQWLANLGIALFAVPLVLLGPTAGRLAQRIGPFIVASAGMLIATMFMGFYGVLTTGVAIFAVAMCTPSPTDSASPRAALPLA